MKRITDKNRWIGSDEFQADRERKRLLLFLGIGTILVAASLGTFLVIAFM